MIHIVKIIEEESGEEVVEAKMDFPGTIKDEGDVALMLAGMATTIDPGAIRIAFISLMGKEEK